MFKLVRLVLKENGMMHLSRLRTKY